MGTLQSSGIYVQEIAQPTGISRRPTCVPLFIGYTEKSTDSTGRHLSKGERSSVSSLAEFERDFGNPGAETLRIMLDEHGNIVTQESYSPFYLHASVAQYFANGGEICEILSVGPFPDIPDAASLEAAITQLPDHAIFTMIAIPDAASLAALPQIQQKLLDYCHQQYHCLAILDVPYCRDATLNTTIADYRHRLGKQHLRNGAAFLPWLEILRPSEHDFSQLEIKYTPGVASAWNQYHKATKLQSSLIRKRLQGSATTTISRMIPPSGSIIGLLHANDLQHGTWKLPSMIGIQGVHALSASINDTHQGELNIDPTGKSLNAIRRFSGKGIVLWGGRTLASNDSEWRYISVVRTIGLINASIQHYLSTQSFTANDTKTWSLIRLSIDAFLTTLWRDGALHGAKREEAFFVKIGLNESMTEHDMATGRINIQIGLALIKPAEFIMLNVQHLIPSLHTEAAPTVAKVLSKVRKTKVRAQTSPINVAIKQRQQQQSPRKPASLDPAS